MNELYLVAVWSDGSVSHETMLLVGRFPTTPVESGWRYVGTTDAPPNAGETWGKWVRASTDANCVDYLARVAQRRLEMDGVTLARWRRITQAEHEMFERERTYRNAIEEIGGALGHDMVKARELHRAHLRHLNGEKLLLLDREWVDASATGQKAEADAVQAKRQALRDFVNDPRIDAAPDLATLKAIVPPDDA